MNHNEEQSFNVRERGAENDDHWKWDENRQACWKMTLKFLKQAKSETTLNSLTKQGAKIKYTFKEINSIKHVI